MKERKEERKKRRKERKKKRGRKASRQARKMRRKTERRRQGREGGRKKIRNLVYSCCFIEMSRGHLIPKVLKIRVCFLWMNFEEIPKKLRALKSSHRIS